MAHMTKGERRGDLPHPTLNPCAKLHSMAGSPDMLTFGRVVVTALSRVAQESLQPCSVTSAASWNTTWLEVKSEAH